MPKITVAMASYNHEKYVGEAIESVLSQDEQDFDFIIVDDASTDNTVGEILKFKDPRIKFISNSTNQGACLSLTKAIKEGKGDYISILNSDDCFLPNKLKKQKDFLDKNLNIHAVFGLPEIINDFGEPIENSPLEKYFMSTNRSRYEWLQHFFRNGNCLLHPSVMIRRECYEHLGYYHPYLIQIPDFEFWIRLCFHYDIHVMPEKMTQWRILDNNRNTCAFTKDTAIRTKWEMPIILKNYLNIKNLQEFFLIFPEEKDEKKLNDPEMIKFYLSQICLRSSLTYFFGLQTLFSLLEDPSAREKILNNGYSIKDYLKTTSAQIFYESYNEKWFFFKHRLKSIMEKFFSRIRLKRYLSQ